VAIVAWIVYGALTIATVALLLGTLAFNVLARGFVTSPQDGHDFSILWGILGFFWFLVVVLHVLWKGAGRE
jgi:hypothetical protein